MSSSFDLSEVDAFTVGTEGPPGRRVFFLQAVAGPQVVTLRLEKQQVALLADYLDRLLVTYEFGAAEPVAMPDLAQPLLSEWIIGSMMVAIDEARSMIVIIAEEMVLIEVDPDDPDDDIDLDDEPSGAQARFCLTRSQVEAFVEGAREVIGGGRPICRLCGGPMNAEGHSCPRMN